MNKSRQNAVKEQDLLLIKQGKMVADLVETEGWKQIVSPLIDKMIVDVVGGKEGSVWNTGSFGDKRLGEVKADRLLWYRQALIELNNHIYSYLEAGKNAEERLKSDDERMVKINPMLEGPYAHAPKAGEGWSSYERSTYQDENGGISG